MPTSSANWRMAARQACANDAVVVIDARRVIRFANPACDALFGLRPASLVGEPLATLGETFRAWYDATHGVGGFDQLGRIPTGDWADYLDWFREQVGVDVRRGVRLESIEPTDDGHIALHLLRVDGSPEEGTTRRWVETARKVVLAAGVSGTGGPLIPEVVAELSPAVFAHTADAIDFAALTGKSVAVLGAGPAGAQSENDNASALRRP